MVLLFFGLIITFIILIIFLMRNIEDQLFKGFWTANSDFCEKAELQLFVLYIDKQNWLTNTCTGYILAANELGFFLNNNIELSLGYSWNFSPFIACQKKYEASMKILNDQDDVENIENINEKLNFPDKFSIIYFPIDGKLIIYKNDEVLVELWKDTYNSAIAKIQV